MVGIWSQTYGEEPRRDGRHERPATEVVDVVAVGVKFGTLDLSPRHVGPEVYRPSAVPLGEKMRSLCADEIQQRTHVEVAIHSLDVWITPRIDEKRRN